MVVTTYWYYIFTFGWDLQAKSEVKQIAETHLQFLL